MGVGVARPSAQGQEITTTLTCGGERVREREEGGLHKSRQKSSVKAKREKRNREGKTLHGTLSCVAAMAQRKAALANTAERREREEEKRKRLTAKMREERSVLSCSERSHSRGTTPESVSELQTCRARQFEQ